MAAGSKVFIWEKEMLFMGSTMWPFHLSVHSAQAKCTKIAGHVQQSSED